MDTRPQDAADQKRPDKPPAPGGDPDQPPQDLPSPRPGQDKGKEKRTDKTGFGHIGNKDVPSTKESPEPRDIF